MLINREITKTIKATFKIFLFFYVTYDEGTFVKLNSLKALLISSFQSKGMQTFVCNCKANIRLSIQECISLKCYIILGSMGSYPLGFLLWTLGQSRMCRLVFLLLVWKEAEVRTGTVSVHRERPKRSTLRLTGHPGLRTHTGQPGLRADWHSWRENCVCYCALHIC